MTNYTQHCKNGIKATVYTHVVGNGFKENWRKMTALTSCSFFGDRINRKKLAGRYVFQIDKSDTLDVYPGGTYHIGGLAGSY